MSNDGYFCSNLSPLNFLGKLMLVMRSRKVLGEGKRGEKRIKMSKELVQGNVGIPPEGKGIFCKASSSIRLLRTFH